MKQDKDRTYTLEEMQGHAPSVWMVLLATIGLFAIAVATLLPILNVHLGPQTVTWWKYVYAGGALMFLVGKILSPYTGIHPRIKRLYRIEAWAGIFFAVAAFFLFYNGAYTRDSWAFTLAGAVLIVFTTLTIPKTIRRQLRKNKEKEQPSAHPNQQAQAKP